MYQYICDQNVIRLESSVSVFIVMFCEFVYRVCVYAIDGNSKEVSVS